MRNEIAKQTPLGLEAKQLMDKGDLVGDSIVIGMIESKLDSNPDANGFIFDGFPRTQAQALRQKLLGRRSMQDNHRVSGLVQPKFV